MTEWSTIPFIDYLNAVDALLEARHGRPSRQDELTIIAASQEAGDSPEVCAGWLLPLVRTGDIGNRCARTWVTHPECRILEIAYGLAGL